MTKEKWDSLSPEQRKKAIIKHDRSGTMREPRWAPLLEDMSRPYDQLTRLQQEAVEDMP